ncbi:DNA polymerase IV [Thalassotalea sp. LPB0316]|nr:DNA polymerase IV [Thalassotalea sp. LPB0316]
MDCFYAAVEMRDNPEYANIPLAVGGEGKRSVLSTCNYLARSYGVRSAMPSTKAKVLCPSLKIVHGRMAVYKQVSEQIREIFSRYTTLVEPLSLDEAFLDVTDSHHCQGSATLIAQEIRQAIYDETGLTASAGVAPNKFLAKIASDENKPNGIFVISPDKVSAFVEQLSLKKIPGIGPKTFDKLNNKGFYTCADVRQASVKQLQVVVGSFAQSLYRRSFGEDDREVVSHRERKSVAIERTFSEDFDNTEEACWPLVEQLVPALEKRLAKHHNKQIVKQGIKLKFADFNQTTVEQRSSGLDICVLKCLLQKALERSSDRKVRLIGITIGFGSETKISAKQLDLPIIQ